MAEERINNTMAEERTTNTMADERTNNAMAEERTNNIMAEERTNNRMTKEKGQTIQWPKKKDKQYNGRRKDKQYLFSCLNSSIPDKQQKQRRHKLRKKRFGLRVFNLLFNFFFCFVVFSILSLLDITNIVSYIFFSLTRIPHLESGLVDSPSHALNERRFEKVKDATVLGHELTYFVKHETKGKKCCT